MQWVMSFLWVQVELSEQKVKGKKMKNIVRLVTILAISLALLGGCASNIEHDYIQSGQVVTVNGKDVLVCVSDTDSLKNHSVFNVYRTVYEKEYSIELGGGSKYSRELVGSIRLGEKKDKHFAEAIVLSGELARYDMVEFDGK
jgi:uncharacterized protein YceK